MQQPPQQMQWQQSSQQMQPQQPQQMQWQQPQPQQMQWQQPQQQMQWQQPQPQMQWQQPPQMQHQQQVYNKQSNSSGSWFQPCGDGSIIPFGRMPPQMTILLRMLVRNCLWIIIFLILILLFVKYLIHPCYEDCRSFFLIETMVTPIPYIGPIAARIICFFACFFIKGLEFFFNGFTKILGI